MPTLLRLLAEHRGHEMAPWNKGEDFGLIEPCWIGWETGASVLM